MYTHGVTQSTRKNGARHDAVLPRLERRHRALLSQLTDVGFVLRGSIARRSTICGKPTCRCKASPPQLHGPYYVWTRKVDAKTVTAQLAPEVALRCQEWSANMRRLDQIVRELQTIGLQAAASVRQSALKPRPAPATDS